MTIITFKTETLNLSTKFVEVTTPKGELAIDVKNLLSQPIHSDSAYFNATEIAKMYGKLFAQITRTKEWKILGRDKITARGRHDSGTWLPIFLLADYLRMVIPTEDYYKLIKSGVLNDIATQYKVVEKKHIYILLSDDKTIKIGITSNFNKRLTQIKNASGKNIINYVFTDKIKGAYPIEQFLLAYFDDYRINGEWLKGIDFNTVVNKLYEQIEKTYLNDIQIDNNRIQLIEVKK